MNIDLSSEGFRAFLDSAFSRNLGILSPSEQAALFGARVAIPGLGGVGGLYCMTFARLGVCNFHIADSDYFEVANMNRQYGAMLRHLGQLKIKAINEEIHQINPHASVRLFSDGLTLSNLNDFLSEVDVVIDGLDFFAFKIRRALFNRARELGIPVITAAPLGFTSSILVFTPDSMSFDEYFDVRDGMSIRECLLRFAVGLAPGGLHLGQMDSSRVSFDYGKGPSLGVACLLCSSLAATEAIRLITGRPGGLVTPSSYQVDPIGGRCKRCRLGRGNKSILQRIKIWYVRNVILGGDAGKLRSVPSTPAHMPSENLSSEHLRWLVHAGQQAPSGDNCQPWSFRISDETIRLYLEPEADKSFFNYQQLASVIACGAAVQNIISAAPGIGLDAHPVLLPEVGEPNLMTQVHFSKGDVCPSPLGDAVWIRCTNRRMFLKRPVDEYCREELIHAANPASLFMLYSSEKIARLAGVLYHADRIRVERRDLHEHFVGMTRFDPPDGSGFEDGLPLKNLYAGAAGERFLRLTRPWSAMRAANLLGLGRLVALHSKLAMESSPLAGLVCVKSSSMDDFLKGGMAMERVWLTATRLGLAVQPMTAVTLFWLRWRLEGPGAFSAAHRRLLKRVWPVLMELFPLLGDDCWPVMLFRAGHAKPIRFGTPRRRVENVLREGGLS